MALAFRLFGKFEWPPTASATKEVVPGVLEIHYANGWDGQRRPYLRWYPHKVDSPPPLPLPKVLPNLPFFASRSSRSR